MQNIIIDEANKLFLINTSDWSYGMGVNENGHLCNLHWGGSIRDTSDLPSIENCLFYKHRKPERSILKRQEYPGWGDAFYDEPALKASFADGTRCCVLVYKSCEKIAGKNAETLKITLEDKFYPLQVDLFYRVFTDCAILERWSQISNNGVLEIELESVMSAAFNLPRNTDDYRLTHLSGRWGKEATINQIPVTQSRTILESRTGLSGPHAVPYFALDRFDADEKKGRVWFGSVEWSGNWKIAVYRDAYEEVSVVGGVNDFDFSYPLAPENSFTTPVFCCGLSSEGFGGASRMLHDYQRLHLLPPAAAKPLPLIVNTWASLHADVDEKSVMGVIEKSGELGAELFVIDDGWQKALGDWVTDLEKFPRGLEPLINRAKELGMDFGLWVEIESIEERSEIFRQHPEWVMQYKNRPRHSKYREDVDRTTYLINFAHEDVCEYFYRQLHRLVEETGITYLKLDMNYFFTDPGWNEMPKNQRRTIWYHYAANIHKLFRKLSSDFPTLRIENCASGCSRSDLGMSRYFSRINRSDNQDPLDILKLHEGFSKIHLPGLAGGACHISDDMHHINGRHIPLTFQAIAGMLGSLAIGKNLPECPQEEIDAITYWAKLYKKFRAIVYCGDFYILYSHYNNAYAAYQYVSKDKTKSLIFTFAQACQFSVRLPVFELQGLTDDATYTIEAFGNDSPYQPDYHQRSGSSLMEIGLQSDLLGDYQARLFYLEKQQ